MMTKKTFNKIVSIFLSITMIVTCINYIYNTNNVDIYAQEANYDGDTTLSTTNNTSTTYSTSSSNDRETMNINADWKFNLGDISTAYNKNYNDSSWKEVDLPHDFSISQTFTTSGEAESGFLPGGTGWYRKTLGLDSTYSNQRVVIDFDGVYKDAYVYVNGTYVGEHHYGYTNFAFDITDYLNFDEADVIAVKVENDIPSSRWYSGSGIYRDVNLIISDDIHVAYHGTTITTPDIKNNIGTVNVDVEVDNDSDTSANIVVRNIVYTSDGVISSSSVDTSSTISANSSKIISSTLSVSSPELWDVDNPNLYYVQTEILKDNVVLDTYKSAFGFRYFEFKSTGFYLNGKALKLNGVCMHHDQGALGSAAYYDAMYRQLSIMKDMGANAIRTAHNPADQQFIEICNELGLLVIEEAFDGWIHPKNTNSNDFSTHFNVTLGSNNQLLNGSSSMTYSEYAIKSMVKRDKNAPSIIAWSLCNEVQEGTTNVSYATYASIAEDLIGYIEEIDTTRPVTSGDNNRGGNSYLVNILNTITDNDGVVGFNYSNTSSELSSLQSSFGGGICIIASETSSAVNSRGIYTTQTARENADGKFHLTSYDTSAVTWGITAHDSIYNTYQLDQVAGEFVWTGFDYIGEPTPWNGTGSGSVSYSGAIPNSSYFGIVETTGFEKDTYYLYRSQWNKKDTTLHLVTAWDSDNMMTTSGKTPVWIYSNAAKVELYRNDVLVGTATRKVNTTNAGHQYYTYTTSSNNSSVCTAVSGSGSTSLYSVFNVAYEAGTIKAIAYDENGNVITNTQGSSSVSTPGTVTQLHVSADKTNIDADGSSLVYIEVDVLDALGNLDTTATNTINFTLEGEGEILGVDNGDQATLYKYQQSSVLPSSKSANIAAYAGKALVICRSTTTNGTFNVNVTSSGLTGGNVTVTTNKVIEETPTYAYTNDYTVKVGTMPSLDTNITKTVGTEVTTGTITWDTSSLTSYINTAGDYSLSGNATFSDGINKAVTLKLHVIDNIIAMRNIATTTMQNTIPTLPTTVYGLLADATLSTAHTFKVEWEEMTTDMFDTVGEVVVVNGVATIMGNETLPVTASIRVSELIITESSNVATSATLSQDITNISDNLNSINNGITKPGDNTNERWSNWNNRTTSDTATITLNWATAQLVDSAKIYYYQDGTSDHPESVTFLYSLDGNNYQEVKTTATLEVEYSSGFMYSYVFDQTINPVAMQVVLTQQNGTSGSDCVAITELEVYTSSGEIEYNTSSLLSMISVDGNDITHFNSETYNYEASGTQVSATGSENMGITILPVYEGVVRVVTLSEDEQSTSTYAVTLTQACNHTNTTLQNKVDATCTTSGYSGDEVCNDCGTTITTGQVIDALGHQNTELIGKVDATCTEEGYSGDLYCHVCQSVVEQGNTINALGHNYNQGVVVVEPTYETTGEKLYTCQRCNHTYTEVLPVLEVAKIAPTVTLNISKDASTGKIVVTGQFIDYENVNKYYDIIDHGIVYYSATKLGTRTLTVNTGGRTKVSFKNYNADGTFTYSFTSKYATTRYAFRSYLAYKDEYGRTIYIYSKQQTASFNSLSN